MTLSSCRPVKINRHQLLPQQTLDMNLYDQLVLPIHHRHRRYLFFLSDAIWRPKRRRVQRPEICHFLIQIVLFLNFQPLIVALSSIDMPREEGRDGCCLDVDGFDSSGSSSSSSDGGDGETVRRPGKGRGKANGTKRKKRRRRRRRSRENRRENLGSLSSVASRLSQCSHL